MLLLKGKGKVVWSIDGTCEHVNGQQLPLGAALKAADDAELAAARPDGTISSAARGR